MRQQKESQFEKTENVQMRSGVKLRLGFKDLNESKMNK